MADRKRPIVVVHGVGTGTNADCAGFSRALAQNVGTRRRFITRVGTLPDDVEVKRDIESHGVLWEEALWESEHDEEDAAVQLLLKGLGAGTEVLQRIAGFFLDLMLDVPLYLGPTGVGVRKRVRSVIAAHPGCIVVGHSLGSVIAADVLARSHGGKATPLDVAALVTLGSPLNLLRLRTPLKRPFPFPWQNYHYDGDPICFGDALGDYQFPGVTNFELSKDEGYGVAHTHYWAAPIVARSVRKLSRDS